MMRRRRNRPLYKLTRSHEYITLFSIQIWNGREYEGQVQKICSEDETISTEERSDHPSNASLFQPFINNTFKVSAIQLVSCNRQSEWREPQVDKWQWIFFFKDTQCSVCTSEWLMMTSPAHPIHRKEYASFNGKFILAITSKVHLVEWYISKFKNSFLLENVTQKWKYLQVGRS